MAMGAFAPSLLEWVGSSKAMALRMAPPGYLSPVAMRARVGSEYPVLPLHGAACWLGMFSLVVVEFHGCYSRLQREGTNKGNNEASLHMHIIMREYVVDIFSRAPHEWTWISTTPEGSSIPTPNQTGWDMGVAFLFVETRAWAWISTTHTSPSIRDTPKPGVPVAIGSVRVCMPLF